MSARDAPMFSLVFPAYNPGARLASTWREVERFLHHAPSSWEVLFVCDGCTDGSRQRLAELTRAQASRVRVLSHTPNRGKGYAVRRGLAAARGAWRIFTDIDLSYGLDGVQAVAETLQDGAEVVVTSRLHPESRFLMPAALVGYAYRRRFQSVVFSALARWLLGLTQRDPQSGLKGFSARAVQLILPHLSCEGFAFDCEILLACRHLGLAVTELPVCFRYLDGTSTTNLRAAARMVGEVWQLRRGWRGRTPAPQSHEQLRAA